MGDYKAWKLDRKPKAIRAYLPNIIEALKSFRNFSDEDAKLIAKEHANWVDTSEEELLETDFEDYFISSDDNKQDDGKEDEDANVDEDEEFQDPQDPVSADQNPPVVARNPPTTASDAPLNNIDDFTPTQVLFGHGSFGGIVLSQPGDGGIPGLQSTTAPPLQTPASAKGTEWTIADDEGAVCLDSPSPPQTNKSGMDPRPGGPCTPAAHKGKQTVEDTPQSSPLHQRSHSPGTFQEDRLVPRGPEVVRMSQLFAQWMSTLPQSQEAPREHILASQEFSQSYSKRSHLADLIEAVTFENSQSPTLQTILSYVDEKIHHAIQGRVCSDGSPKAPSCKGT
ncbi:unnamed protein product [Calypogeia fissa]